jgi:hypothetical protein
MLIGLFIVRQPSMVWQEDRSLPISSRCMLASLRGITFCIKGSPFAVPEMARNPQQRQSVGRKSKIEDLFSRLCSHYAPWLKASRYPPAHVIIARARLWREQPIPELETVYESVERLGEKGLPKEGVWFVIGLCESIFRPLRAVELALESLFPDFLLTQGKAWPPSPVALELLKSDFLQQWQEKEKRYGTGWVLVAGSTPLRIRHRPKLIAPWVTGVAVKRWLMLETIGAKEAEDLAVELAALLLVQEVRPEELRHWEGLLDKVEITTGEKKVLLTAGIISAARRVVARQLPIDFVQPKEFLDELPLDAGVCNQIRLILEQAWGTEKRSARKPLAQDTSREVQAGGLKGREKGNVVNCNLCKESLEAVEVWKHLQEAHDVAEDDIDLSERGNWIRRKSTGETLGTWVKVTRHKRTT